MSFFGIGKKKWDEQAREAESTAAQDGHEESKPSRGSGLSDKIMEQQQWEDSLRRFVKSEGTRQNRDEERSEEYRAVEDLKRALLHDDEETPRSPRAPSRIPARPPTRKSVVASWRL